MKLRVAFSLSYLHSGPSLAADFYVSPTAGASGNGRCRNPWKLQTALNQPGGFKPGDTIWLRGGTYTRDRFASQLNGSPTSPIIFRQYPGERATLDGGIPSGQPILVIIGAYIWFWGFEVMVRRSRSASARSPVPAPRHRDSTGASECHRPDRTHDWNQVHQHGRARYGQGFSFWEGATPSEFYGCIVYYNGWGGARRGSRTRPLRPEPGRLHEVSDRQYRLPQFRPRRPRLHDGCLRRQRLLEGNTLVRNGARRRTTRATSSSAAHRRRTQTSIRNYFYYPSGGPTSAAASSASSAPTARARCRFDNYSRTAS